MINNVMHLLHLHVKRSKWVLTIYGSTTIVFCLVMTRCLAHCLVQLARVYHGAYPPSFTYIQQFNQYYAIDFLVWMLFWEQCDEETLTCAAVAPPCSSSLSLNSSSSPFRAARCFSTFARAALSVSTSSSASSRRIYQQKLTFVNMTNLQE